MRAPPWSIVVLFCQRALDAHRTVPRLLAAAPSPLEDKDKDAIAASCCRAFAGRVRFLSRRDRGSSPDFAARVTGFKLHRHHHLFKCTRAVSILLSPKARVAPRQQLDMRDKISACGNRPRGRALGASDASRALLGSAIWPSTICASASISPRPRILPTPPRARSSRDCGHRLRRLPSSRGTRQRSEADLEETVGVRASKPSAIACAHVFRLASPSAVAVEQTALRRLSSLK